MRTMSRVADLLDTVLGKKGIGNELLKESSSAYHAIQSTALSPRQRRKLAAAVELAKHVMETSPLPDSISSPEDACAHFRKLFSAREVEQFGALYLNTRHHVLAAEVVFVGSGDRCLVVPRDIFRTAVRVGAVAVIVGHNHPSGDCTPSTEDGEVTDRLVKAGKVIGVSVLDHIIIGNGYRSMSALGEM